MVDIHDGIGFGGNILNGIGLEFGSTIDKMDDFGYFIFIGFFVLNF